MTNLAAHDCYYPQPVTFRLPPRNIQALTTPLAFDAFVVPTQPSERSNAMAAVAIVLCGNRNDPANDTLLVI